MPIQKIHHIRPQATISPTHSMQIQTLIPRPVMSTPQGFKKHQTLMTEAQVRRKLFEDLLSEIDANGTYTLQSLPLGVPRFKTLPQDALSLKDTMLKMQTIRPAFPKYYDNRQVTFAFFGFSSTFLKHFFTAR